MSIDNVNMTIGAGVRGWLAGWHSYRWRATREITQRAVFVDGCKIIKQRNAVNGVCLCNIKG